MSSSDGRATVRVRLEIEVEVGVWNATESFASLSVQAAKEAAQKARNMCAKVQGARVVGEPKTMHVILVGDLS